jgi:hypothetical protein
MAVNKRLGNNARLIEQKGAYGHGIVSDISYCTLAAVRAYMLNGTVPSAKHSLCEVDQKPWMTFDLGTQLTKRGDDTEWPAMQAWTKLYGMHRFKGLR